MIRYIVTMLPILLSMGSISQKTGSVYSPGPYEIVVDASAIRGELGWTWMNLYNLNDSLAHRNAQAFHVRNEFRILSSLFDKYSEFVIWDAFYFGIQLGKVTSKTLGEELPDNEPLKEGKFAVSSQFGYNFYTGYRNKYWGLLAGIQPQWAYTSAGDFSMSASRGGLDLLRFTSPLAIRAEWRPFAHFEYRIVAQAWKSFFGDAQQSGVRLELPTFPGKRYWIFIDYSIQPCVWQYLSTENGPQGKYTSLMIGLRAGSLM